MTIEMSTNDHIPDFKIMHDGTWIHDGAPIKREALAKLFGRRALKIDEDGYYWLQTPYEKYPIIVEDVPFVIVEYVLENGVINLRTNMDEHVAMTAAHPLELRKNKVTGDILPYVHLRDGLYARLGRSVYYALVQEFGESVTSDGVTYPLGIMSE